MEINLLSENKLRISLSKSDINTLGIKNGLLDAEYLKNSTAFKGLLESARIKTGFDPADAPLSVSVYKNSDGGCDMYIMKTAKPKTRIKEPERTENVIFRYGREEDMSKACHAMYSVGCTDEASAYYEKTCSGYRYYLIIRKKASLYPVCIAREYSLDGEYLPNDTYIPYIFEHCRIICEKNAVSVLAKTVSNVV